MKACVCILAAAVAVMMIAAPALPQQILIWDNDQNKVFANPEGGGNIGCEYWIKQALTNNGYTHSTWSSMTLPADISGYDIIFVVLGWC
jgi:hypothetical protein